MNARRHNVQVQIIMWNTAQACKQHIYLASVLCIHGIWVVFDFSINIKWHRIY